MGINENQPSHLGHPYLLCFQISNYFHSLRETSKKGLFFVSNEYYNDHFSKHEVPN